MRSSFREPVCSPPQVPGSREPVARTRRKARRPSFIAWALISVCLTGCPKPPEPRTLGVSALAAFEERPEGAGEDCGQALEADLSLEQVLQLGKGGDCPSLAELVVYGEGEGARFAAVCERGEDDYRVISAASAEKLAEGCGEGAALTAIEPTRDGSDLLVGVCRAGAPPVKLVDLGRTDDPKMLDLKLEGLQVADVVRVVDLVQRGDGTVHALVTHEAVAGAGKATVALDWENLHLQFHRYRGRLRHLVEISPGNDEPPCFVAFWSEAKGDRPDHLWASREGYDPGWVPKPRELAGAAFGCPVNDEHEHLVDEGIEWNGLALYDPGSADGSLGPLAALESVVGLLSPRSCCLRALFLDRGLRVLPREQHLGILHDAGSNGPP